MVITTRAIVWVGGRVPIAILHQTLAQISSVFVVDPTMDIALKPTVLLIINVVVWVVGRVIIAKITPILHQTPARIIPSFVVNLTMVIALKPTVLLIINVAVWVGGRVIIAKPHTLPHTLPLALRTLA